MIPHVLLSPRFVSFVGLSFLIGIFPTQALATSIVIVRTEREIIMGADSRQNFLDPATPSCAAEKIRQVGNVFFTASGIAGNDGPTGFNVHREAFVAAKGGGGLAAIADRLEKGLTGKLLKLAEEVRHNTPEIYRRDFADKELASVVFAGMENGIATLLYRGFELFEEKDNSLSLRIIRHACPQECSDVFFSLFLGETKAIDKYLAQNPGLWMGGFMDGVRKLIEVEIAARPDIVGPPLTLLRIGADGVRWVSEGYSISGMKTLDKCPAVSFGF